jgi:hypothetical protein
VLHYGKGDNYHPHVDYLIRGVADRELELLGQRIITFLMYLNAVEEGGETAYVRAGLRVKPSICTAVMHFNCLPDGSEDKMSEHISSQVEKGDKWIARKAIHEKLYYGEEIIISNKKRETGTQKNTTKIGRNALCVCGSGKKYKHCCGKINRDAGFPPA